ncbi:hypothetical protein [Pelagicoccus sp. SDUM812002]|uniref:energy transducer TonB n=1 Tax=Pelagicoccus sp. SDUM812002 TaxID=3041266 RepID=UPI00280E4A30|nr:hypothetical protein [Pelagicoccus sp. SDUM812002]MDQ8187178.1 hypothetical protein [Pelagicoccus sp. SDUM812002]
MTLKAPRIPLVLSIFLLSQLLGNAVGKPEANTAVSIKRQIEPRYPGWAYTHGVSSGYAKIAFYVDENGIASDFLPIEYTYEAFADELMSTIKKWDFIPATQNGAPVKSVCHAYWEFRPDRAIETNALFDTSKRMDGNGKNAFRTLKYREDDELDSRIGMTAFPGLAITRDSSLLDLDRQTVRAHVSFFVDQRGKVVLPHIVDTTDPQVSDQLEQAFKQAAFALPTYKGEPTIALIERTYDFPILWVDEELPQSL